MNISLAQSIKKITSTSVTALGAITLVVGLFSSQTILAEDRFVTDMIYIPLRSDKDNQAGIVKNALPTGTKLKFLREEEDNYKNKWSLVMTPDGVEGWIRSQNLINEPTAALKLDVFSKSSSDVAELQRENLKLKNDLESLNNSYKALQKESEDMHAMGNSDINLEQENQNVHQEYQKLQVERDVLKAENDHLRGTDKYNQRIYGGLLILCGILLSFLLQMVGGRKKKSDWD